MKKIWKSLLIVQTCLMYISLTFFLGTLFIINLTDNEDITNTLLTLGLIIGIIALLIGGLNFVFSIINIFKGGTSPINTTIVIKMVLIPWYLGNFFVWFLLVGAFSNPFLFIGIPLIICIGVFITYMYMIFISAPNISYVFSLIKNKEIHTNKLLIVSLVFHFIFCLDVIGSFMLKKALKDALIENQ